MIPGGALATVFLLSLVPGYLFLRLSETARRPRPQNALTGFLEVVTVGIATTGTSIVFWVLTRPGSVIKALERPTSSADLRGEAVLAVAVLGLATSLAVVWAWLVRRRRPNRFQLSVWHDVLNRDKIPPGHLSVVALQLNNGVTVTGILHSYTWATDVAHRDIALTRPIAVTCGSKTEQPDYDFMTVAGDQIRHVALKYARNVAAPDSSHGPGSP